MPTNRMLDRIKSTMIVCCVLQIVLSLDVWAESNLIKSYNKLSAEPSSSFNYSDSNYVDNSKLKLVFSLGGNAGFPFSSDIENFFNDFQINNGLGWSFGINVGFRNIVQVEFRKAFLGNSLSKHETGPYTLTGSNTGDIIADIALDYDFTEILLKFNPLLVLGDEISKDSKFRRAYLMFGIGEVSYQDTVDDGFEGDYITYGIGYDATEIRYGNNLIGVATIGLTMQDVNFDSARFMGIDYPTDLDGIYFGVEASIGIGLRI